MMNKYLFLTTLLGVMIFGVGGVFAYDQPVTVNIDETVLLDILPLSLDFGNVVHGTQNNPATENITFDPSGSNVDVTVTLMGINGFPFETGLKFDGANPINQSWTMSCTHIDDDHPCEGHGLLPEILPTLDIPFGAGVGTYSGVIVYSIAGESFGTN